MDISKHPRVGAAMPQQTAQQKGDQTETTCAEHKQPFIAFSQATETMLCKLCMFKNPKNLG